MSFSVVDRVVGNTERYKAIANRVPLCHEFVTEGPTLLLMTPVHLYAFDATTFDELCFEDATRVREQKTPHSTFVVPVRERTNRNSFLPPCVKKSSVAGRGFIGTPQLLLRPMVNASNRALPFISHLSLSSAWIHHAAGSHVVVIKFADPVDSESEQVKNSISRVRIAPKQSPEGAELHIPILEPATLEPWPEEAARFVNCLNEFLHQFSARRPARPSVELVPETTAEWAEELKTSVERSGRESRMAKSIAKTDRSRARTANGVDTWGSRKNAQLLRDVLSGDWSSLLDIKFDGDNAPADSRWDPLFDALRTRVVPQNYIDDSQYRPVLLHFNSVEDLSAELLSRFFDAVESNYMRVISVNIEGFCPKFGNDGLKRLLSLVERDNNCVSSFNIAPTVMEADALLDPILRGKSQQVLDNIARQVTRAAMAKRRVSPLL